MIIRVTLAGLVPGYYTQMLAEYPDHQGVHPEHVRVHLFQSGLEPGHSRLQLGHPLLQQGLQRGYAQRNYS